jgi:hypothetical protein
LGARGRGWVALDGDYHMDTVEHRLDAQTGFTTRVDVSKLGVVDSQELK